MFALIFFIILNVHINVSKLETSLDDNKLDINHELIVQGISNLVSAPFGAFQGIILSLL